MEDFKLALDLIAASNEAALSTLEEGKPFNSAVSYFYQAGEKFGTAVMLISSMAKHTKNLQKSPEVSLLVTEPGEAYVYERKRVSAQGTAVLAPKEKFQDYQNQYLKLFPRAKILFSLPDFQFYEIKISSLHYIGGFGKIRNFK